MNAGKFTVFVFLFCLGLIPAMVGILACFLFTAVVAGWNLFYQLWHDWVLSDANDDDLLYDIADRIERELNIPVEVHKVPEDTDLPEYMRD